MPCTEGQSGCDRLNAVSVYEADADVLTSVMVSTRVVDV